MATGGPLGLASRLIAMWSPSPALRPGWCFTPKAVFDSLKSIYLPVIKPQWWLYINAIFLIFLTLWTFSSTERLNELYSEHPRAHHLDAPTDTNIFTLTQIHLPIHQQPISLKQFSKCYLETPEDPWDPFGGPRYKKYFQNNYKRLFAFFTLILSRVYSEVFQTWYHHRWMQKQMSIQLCSN